MPEHLVRHLPHATPSPTSLSQYVGALQAHTPPAVGALMTLGFFALVIYACFRAGSRRRSRD